MWTEIVFEQATAQWGIDRFHELQSHGLKPGIDFDWKYVPATTWYAETKHLRSVVMMFKDPSLATFYSLKWQR